MTSVELRRPATSLDVAKLAGVSRSTVSNILNGNHERFPEATRQRVLDAAATLDYRPSPAGRSLVNGRSDTVVVLMPNSTFGTNLQDAVDRVVAGTTPIGGNVVVRFASGTIDATVDSILALRPMAVMDFGVLSVDGHERVEKQGTIVVPRRSRDALQSDGGIAQMQAEELLRKAPRSLWFAALSDKRLDFYGPLRFAALTAFCAQRGLEQPRSVSVSLDLASGTDAVNTMMASGEPIGVVSYNDDVALTILAACQRRGVDVPDELSVVGVDNIPLARLWTPPLATIDTNLGALADSLVEALGQRLSQPRMQPATAGKHAFEFVPGGTV